MTQPCVPSCRTFAAVLATVLMAATMLAASQAGAVSRIKDIVQVQGVRSNQLVGYGLVVGLNGTGDRLKTGGFTKQSLLSMLNRLGVKPTEKGLTSENVAAVMVTSDMPPFARQGSRIDVTVSALGDAEDLTGGTLLVTPLLGADGEVYGVAQGRVGIAGFSAEGEASSVSRGVTTSGRIAGGAIVEREVGFDLASLTSIKLNLRNPDFTTARRIASAINAALGEAVASSTDPGTVVVAVPDPYSGRAVDLITDIESLPVAPDQTARVIIDEQSGIIVMGDQVRVSTVAIAQGNLTIRITETPVVSQPAPFAERGRTEVVPRTDIEVDDSSRNRLAVVSQGVTLQELVDGLNALGIGPRDMISILQAIKASGALHADLEVM